MRRRVTLPRVVIIEGLPRESAAALNSILALALRHDQVGAGVNHRGRNVPVFEKEVCRASEFSSLALTPAVGHRPSNLTADRSSQLLTETHPTGSGDGTHPPPPQLGDRDSERAPHCVDPRFAKITPGFGSKAASPSVRSESGRSRSCRTMSPELSSIPSALDCSNLWFPSALERARSASRASKRVLGVQGEGPV